MRRMLGAVLMIWMLVPAGVNGQNTPPEQLQNLDWIVGDWVYEGENSGTWECEWLGEFYVVCDEEFTNEEGNSFKAVEVFGYDANQRMYTYQRFFSTGAHQTANAFKRGDFMLFNLTGRMAGFRRFFLTLDSPTVMRFRWETASGGGAWEVTSEGTARKIQ
jgi:hypothetical protein